MRLSATQQRALDAADQAKLRVSTTWSTWDFWIEGISPMAKATVQRRTIDALSAKGLLVSPESGDRRVLTTDAGSALASPSSQAPQSEPNEET